MLNWFITIATIINLCLNGGSLYAETFAIADIEDSAVHCIDFNGEDFTFTSTSNDWFVGDLVSCVMYDNNTPEDITDDVMLTAKYSGFVQGAWGWDYDNMCEIAYFDY